MELVVNFINAKLFSQITSIVYSTYYSVVLSGLQKYHRNHVLLAKIFERYVQRDDRFEVVGPTRVPT